VKLRASVNTVMNFRVAFRAGKILAGLSRSEPCP
jgi:hypothetical protein